MFPVTRHPQNPLTGIIAEIPTEPLKCVRSIHPRPTGERAIRSSRRVMAIVAFTLRFQTAKRHTSVRVSAQK